jgi:exodeoxyribonuclease VIII
MNPYPISNSRLAAFKRSPAHLIQYLTEDKIQTPAMAFGSAFHAALLEPDLYIANYLAAPEVDRRTKEGKLIYDKFVYEADGKTVISSSDAAKIDAMLTSVLSNSIASELLSSCKQFEAEFTWNNADTGLPMRGFIDAIGPDFIIDVKTTTNADPRPFQSDIFRNQYHRQAAIYLDAIDHPSHVDFYFIAVEKDAPYGVSVHRLDAQALEAGRKMMIDQLFEYRQWVDAGCPHASYEYWHYAGIYDVELPKWMTA